LSISNSIFQKLPVGYSLTTNGTILNDDILPSGYELEDLIYF